MTDGVDISELADDDTDDCRRDGNQDAGDGRQNADHLQRGDPVSVYQSVSDHSEDRHGSHDQRGKRRGSQPGAQVLDGKIQGHTGGAGDEYRQHVLLLYMESSAKQKTRDKQKHRADGEAA